MNSRRLTARASHASDRKDSTPRVRQEVLLCGISIRPMTFVEGCAPVSASATRVTDPGVRISRTRLFPGITCVMLHGSDGRA
jgi:hypothetical protein